MKHLNVDEVYDIIGHLGLSQIIYLIALSSLSFFIAPHLLLNIFVGLETPFICHYTNEENKTNYYHNKCYKNAASNCRLEFNASHKSIIEEWNLVCDEKYKVPMVQSVWMGGILVGALLLGSLADHIGRLKTLMLSIIGLMVFEGASAFSTTFLIMLTLRFLGGIVCSVIILASFVLMQELVGSRKRSLSVIISGLFFPFGIVVLSALAAYTTDWRTLTFISSLYGLPFLILPWILPESPRWMATKGRTEEAKLVLQMMAEKNSRDHLLPSEWTVTLEQKGKEAKTQQGVGALFCYPRLLCLMLILIYSWFVNSCVYYALTLAATTVNPGGNVYWDTILNGFVEVPSNLLLLPIIDRFGRKSSICFVMVVGGILCMLVLFMPTVLVTTFFLIGKMSISASFTAIYLHSGEIFPTVIRNTGMGVLSVASRFGGMVAPFVLMLGDLYPNLHLAVLGLATFLAGVLNLWLPETAGRPTLETFDDLLSLGNHKSNFPNKVLDDSLFEEGYEKLCQESDDELPEEEIVHFTASGSHSRGYNTLDDLT